MGAAMVEETDDSPLMSHTGHALTRHRAFKYAADLNVAQTQMWRFGFQGVLGLRSDQLGLPA